MLLAIKTKDNSRIVPVFPEQGEIGLGTIAKLEGGQGQWFVYYGPRILKGPTTEALCDTFMTNLVTWLNTRNPNSCLTAAAIETMP